MAIEDNTVYGLTGAQIKELPGKIEAVKGQAKVLTAADYNYKRPSSSAENNAIALWLLGPGVYLVKDTPLLVGTSTSGFSTLNDGLYIICTSSGSTSTDIIKMKGYNPIALYTTTTSDGGSVRSTSLLRASDIVNNLTSTSTTAPLSANQGKALKALIDAIVVPTKTSDLTNDSNFVTSTEMDTALADKADANDIPTALSELTNDINAVSDANYVHTDNNYTTPEKTKLAGIATGAEVNVQANWAETDTAADSYIQNKPTIPAAQIQSDWNQTSTVALDYIKNKPTLATVATSGSYNDLTNKPTIPVVHNATLTIQQNGTTVQTFTANASADTTANIEVPVITMTTTDPGEGSALAANSYVAVYGGDPIILDYSTNEVNTGTKWIDGKTIYKKTVQIASLPNATSTGYPHGVSNLGTVVEIKGVHRAGAHAYDLSAPGIGGSQYGLQLSVDATNIYVNVGTDRHLDSADITIYYTKSN